MADAAAAEQFGPYRIHERLGVGGMATVDRASEHGDQDGLGFERVVALKRLLPHLAADASFIKSFVREAKLASALSHVNIVQIYELGRVGGQYFISMEYIDGHDLRHILRRARRVTGPPPVGVTLGLLLQLCDALDYAHGKVDDDGRPMGLVHRDVSPSNLLVTSAGHLKVIDFGIAKAQSAHLRTQTGRVKGKLAYMSPEAIAGRELDARSDLFAAGVIAHELLTARPLFASTNEYQTMTNVQGAEIAPPSRWNPACPGALDAIVLDVLARDPADRPASAGALRERLHVVRRAHGWAGTAAEIATWCAWAFAQEPPSGPQMSFSGPATPTVTPVDGAGPDGDVAVDAIWGGAESDSGAAVLLDDVPDVSRREIRVRTSPGVGDHHRAADTQPGMPPVHEGDGDGDGDGDAAATTAMPATTRPMFVLAAAAPPAPAASEPEPVVRSPSTRPGVAPARAAVRASRPALLLGDLPIPATPPPDAEPAPTAEPAPARSSHTIVWVVAGMAIAGAIAGGAYAVFGRDAAPAVVPRAPAPAPALAPPTAPRTATVHVVTEPPDAEVRIGSAAPHVGTPWSIELPPGEQQIEIRHDGYKAWLTAIELIAGESQTLRVVLERLARAPARGGDATLTLSSNPIGLEVVLDGVTLAAPTPIKTSIAIGPHTLVLRDRGVEVWRKAITAAASADYEFTPSLTASRQPRRAPCPSRTRTRARRSAAR